MEEEKFYSVKEGMLSSPYYPRKIQFLREVRNELLKDTDFYSIPDVVIDENKLNAIKIYRQELRDLPQKYAGQNPLFIVFPPRPTYIIQRNLVGRIKTFIKLLLKGNT